MANEFKIKKGLIVTGASGGTVVDIQGSQGQLFSVTDDLSGSIFAVSDISGVPIFDVNSSGLSTFDGNVNLPDNKKILLGTGNDLEIYHDASHSYIKDIGVGDLKISSNTVRIESNAAENMIIAIANGGVSSYYNNVKKFETTSLGVSVTGDINQGALYYQDTAAGRIGFNRNTTNGVIHDANYNAFQFNGASVSGVNGKFEIQSYNQSGVFGGSITISKTSDLTTSSKVFSAATSSGDASSTLTTKGYVDGLITGATIYRGTWQAGISATSTGTTSSSTTLTVSAAILDAAGNTPVLVGAVVTGAGITGTVKVSSVTSSTVYELDTAISATATAYIFSPIYGAPDLSGVTQTSGYYYICSEAGSATPNGAGTEPNTWSVGDWVIWNDDIGTGEWQKVDNSSVLSGVGTGQTVALWQGASSVTDSETLGNAPITVSGNNSTFAGTINLSSNKGVVWPGGSIRAEGNTLKLVATTLIDLQQNTQVQGTLTTTGNATFAGNVYVGSATTNGGVINLIQSTTNPEIRIQSGESGATAFSIYNTATNPDAEQFFINNNLSSSHLGNARGALKLEDSSGTALTLSSGNATFAGTVTAADLLTVNGDGHLFLGADGETPKIDMMYDDHASGLGWDTRIFIGKTDDSAKRSKLSNFNYSWWLRYTIPSKLRWSVFWYYTLCYRSL